MFRALIVAVVGVIPSLAIILRIETSAQRLAGAPLARWRRLLIPLPIILALAGPALALLASHLFGGAGRSGAHFYWGGVIVLYLALPAMLLLPFLLAGSWRHGLRLLPGVWGYHVLWVVSPYLPWMAAALAC